MKNLSRWQPNSENGNYKIKDEFLNISPCVNPTNFKWKLPPSKSHLIRMVLIASQTNSKVELSGIHNPGEDAISMARCLGQLGVDISIEDGKWTVQGVGTNGFTRPSSLLNCGNSGTSFQLLTALCARLSFVVMIDGDSSLRRRRIHTLWPALKQSGVKMSHGVGSETLPAMVQGPWNPEFIDLDISNSSQPLSALRLAAIGASDQFKIGLSGNPVSRRHFELSDSIARYSGSTDSVSIEEKEIVLNPWEPSLPDSIEIPSDASHTSFVMLFAKTHNVDVKVMNWPDENDCLGNEILREISRSIGLEWEQNGNEISISNSIEKCKFIEVDLRDANDLITPLAAIMAQSGGGKIVGASHASYKESNRITKTVEILSHFGMESVATNDGLEIRGGQKPSKPDNLVLCHGDHRMQMTAVILGSITGATVQGPRLHQVSYPNFLEYLKSSGVECSTVIATIE